jgi:tetraacyldisaccharide 4'-kinase
MKCNLDDGLQDNSINYDLNLYVLIILIGLEMDLTIPAGPLRENINNLKNYQTCFFKWKFRKFRKY